jgi:hypothetical protein
VVGEEEVGAHVDILAQQARSEQTDSPSSGKQQHPHLDPPLYIRVHIGQTAILTRFPQN